jgi:hypothetical protein
MTARLLRDQARLRAQGQRDQLAALIDDAKLCAEMKDAMRLRLRNLWVEAQLAMALTDSMPPKGNPP